MAPFTGYYTVKLHDVDAAGVVFFANIFRIAHDIYEQFLKQIGYTFRERFAAADFILPIAHAEADYLHPLQVGDVIEITAQPVDIGNSSFAMIYHLTDFDGKVLASVRTVHVAVDAKTFRTIRMPENFRKQLLEASHES